MNPTKTVKVAPAQPDTDPRFQLLLTLISLLKNARHKSKKSELEFLMVNQTYNLVPYRHCVYWQWDGQNIEIQAVSGLVQIDQNGPYALWLKKTISGLMERKILQPSGQAAEENQSFSTLIPVTIGDSDGADAEEWRKWVAAETVLLSLKNLQGTVMGGLWIDRDEPFNDLEKAFLEDLADSYAYVLQQFEKTQSGQRLKLWKSVFSLSKSNVQKILLALAIIMVLPVRMSATAPAEIVARAPYVVSVPFDGIIEKVEVTPGQAVKKGDILVRMESTMLKNKSEMAAREMETAQIAFKKTEREAFADRSKLADISILKSQVAQKSAEKRFSDELLSKADIKAERDGIVIFSDANALRGRPAQTGEQIMLLADPQDSELLIRIPVDSMIRIDESVPARFFLNVTPLGFKKAFYESIGYQATQDPDGLLTYKVRASFADKDAMPRVGWTGTGKVYGQRTLVVFNVLRRPIVTLRRKLGV